MDDRQQFANQFVELWQENFEKMMLSGKDMSHMSHVFEKMKGFYEQDSESTDDGAKPAATANADAYGDGNNALLISALSRRVDELEQKLKNLESKCS